MGPVRYNLLSLAMLLGLAGSLTAAPPDPDALARKIDAHLAERFAREQITPAPRADDAEFLRRASLDLIGRIPRAQEVYDVLADESPDKRAKLIERLLDDPRFAIHMSRTWRAELLPEANTDRQVALLSRGFENWLAEQFRANVRYDQWVRELIAVPLPGDGEAGEPVLRAPERPNPVAFLAAKEAKPEQLAAAVSRSFLGVRLECAECHDHPFAKWTQEQFWSQAAFFGGLKPSGDARLSFLKEVRGRHEVPGPQGKGLYQARLLDGTEPKWAADQSPRVVLAAWLTSRNNPFFARAGANRLWGHFFGVGLVEPVDDFHDRNPPSHPELLADLAAAYAGSGFDTRGLIRAICRTEAYSRSSEKTHATQDATRLPARMTAKALTGEQFVDSLTLATGYPDRQGKGPSPSSLLTRFARVGPASEPETSVQQALTLLHGPFLEWATDPERCPTLIAASQTPGLTRHERVEALYMSTLGRRMTDQEWSRLTRGLADDGLSEAERLADIFWVLLNTAEFRLNH